MLQFAQRIWRSMVERVQVLDSIMSHPMSRGGRGKALSDYLRWNIARYTVSARLVVRLPGEIDLIVGRHENYATSVYVHGLSDFWEMLFLAHLLRPGDLFADVGSNVGMYSLWVSRITGARSVALEPVPETHEYLRKNIRLNDMGQLIVPIRMCVGETAGEAFMTVGQGGRNHVVAANGATTVSTPVNPLDDVFAAESPVAMKMDVEGFELKALKGAAKLLATGGLKALLVELQDETLSRYGTSVVEVSELLKAQGLSAYTYDPHQRLLVPLADSKVLNVIFVRKDDPFVVARLKESRKVVLDGYPEGI